MSVQSLLTDFSKSCDSAIEALPELSAIAPPEHGVSLLDVKNELFLSYLQTLALRNLVIIRSIKEGQSFEDVQELNDTLTKTLVQQRVYLEKGVRPLEQRIKYQVDKVIRAASDEEVDAAKKQAQAAVRKSVNKDDTGEEDDSDDDSENELDDLAYRPNPAAFAQAPSEDQNAARLAAIKQDGVYRPPRVSATAMPDIDQKERRERKPVRSTAVDEYIANEMSTAPAAQPSVGTTIVDGGRRVQNARALAEEAERREYEETNLVRLPPESKKDKAKKKSRDRVGFGGEELRGLGENLDRIADLTRKTKTSALDRSRKRRAIEDGPRDDGAGRAFDIKRKRLDKKMRR